MAIDMTREEYIDSKEAAEILKFKSPRHARQALITGGVRCIKVGYNKALFLRKEVNRFLIDRARERGRNV